ncbi:uncharacterized protein LOC119072005 [Bradysia coprophila]|uniref:uncharacterized protein LOC119072005 n=1 Tax=Bradysia coprophila TaxID=38358 RepID=UPI00187DD1C7|nr:uncharacterized protein LOC119072005 [Bradysia coprophila]
MTENQHTVLSDLQQIDGSSSLRASYSNILQQGRDALAHEAENLALPLHLIGQDQHTVLSDLQQIDGSSSLRASRFADMQQTFAVNANPANYRIDSVSSLETTADYHISSNESESFTGLSNANTATSQNPEIGEIIEGSPVVKLRKKKSAANRSSVLVKGPNSGEQLRELEVDGDEVLRSTKKTTDINETDLNASEKRNATQDEIEPEPVGKRIQNKFFTRTAALKSYNDQDETQNELIGMERSWVSNKIGPIKETKSNEEKFKFCQEVCRLSKLPPPLPLDIFEKIEWNYVKNFDTTKLTPGQKFQSATVLADIPRRHAKFLFCHPGPVVDTVSGNTNVLVKQGTGREMCTRCIRDQLSYIISASQGLLNTEDF